MTTSVKTRSTGGAGIKHNQLLDFHIYCVLYIFFELMRSTVSNPYAVACGEHPIYLLLLMRNMVSNPYTVACAKHDTNIHLLILFRRPWPQSTSIELVGQQKKKIQHLQPDPKRPRKTPENFFYRSTHLLANGASAIYHRRGDRQADAIARTARHNKKKANYLMHNECRGEGHDLAATVA